MAYIFHLNPVLGVICGTTRGRVWRGGRGGRAKKATPGTV